MVRGVEAMGVWRATAAISVNASVRDDVIVVVKNSQGAA
jgi:hypothetical protein